MGRNDRRPRKSNNGENKKPNTNKKSFNKNRRPKKLTPGRLVIKYQNLMEQYLTARKKFFSIFGHKPNHQVDKANRNYHEALASLRSFEKDLEGWQQEVLQDQLELYPKDDQYSSGHPEETPENVSFVGEFEDPHLLPVQKSSNWSEDTEETKGSIDDYYGYKGITPPLKVVEEKKSSEEEK